MSEQSHRHYKFYKPYGYLSQFINNQNKRRSKKLLSDLIDLEDVMAVGRLDEKSEGLLLLTTDGKFSQNITSSKFEKEYHVMIDGLISEDALVQLRNGVAIKVNSKPYTTKPCTVARLKNTSHIIDRFVRAKRHGPISWISITLTEGKFRQVRKMTAKVGFPTLRLIRVRIGNYHLEDLKPGQHRLLTKMPEY
ncbi:pseudouridine synthase [Winogradskyella maritima]|uniref:Pseudouridine synthase n=1 Tax=Winogradskyella maritima TaxID=1517766 RepID=A0ABV8AK64_9FLAO|nr:pseudouridine synthase [Winogradskyella maritima]